MTGRDTVEALLREHAPHRRRRRRDSRFWVLRGLAVASVLLLAVALSGVWNPVDECFRIRRVHIELTGGGVLTEQDIRERLGALEGRSFLRLDPGGLEAGILELPRVRAAEVRYRWPGGLVVGVSEREPVALVAAPGGRLLEVSADGVLLASDGSGSADLPILSWEGQMAGVELRPGVCCDLCGAPDLLELLSRMRSECPSLWQGLSQAHLRPDGTGELFWNDVPTVTWLRGRVSPLRLRAWAAVMSDLRARGDLDAVVDLRLREQIVVRLPAEAEDERSQVG